MTQQGYFTHRRNQDGTLDSICMICYRTAASAPCEELLLDGEKTHRCAPRRTDARSFLDLASPFSEQE